MRRILPCLLSLPFLLCAAAAGDGDAKAPAPVNGLAWEILVPPVVASVGPIELQASLRNASAKPLAYATGEKRPPVVLVLTRKGAESVRRPLPEKAQVHRGPARLGPRYPAWSFKADLRAAFGELAPGEYTLQVVHAAKGYKVDVPGFVQKEIASRLVAFEIVKTTLEAACKNSPKTPGFDFSVVKRKDGRRVGVLVNRTGAAVTIWAYGNPPGHPLSTTAMAENWTGRGWDRLGGGFCGTGLECVEIKPGEKREIEMPYHRAGIVRIVISVFEGKKENRVASTPVLVEG